jgi:hypothetical protein
MVDPNIRELEPDSRTAQAPSLGLGVGPRLLSSDHYSGRSDSSIRRNVGVAWASPHWIKVVSEQARVTLVTGFSILADKILPCEMPTFIVTSNVSFPTEAANPVAVFCTGRSCWACL